MRPDLKGSATSIVSRLHPDHAAHPPSEGYGRTGHLNAPHLPEIQPSEQLTCVFKGTTNYINMNTGLPVFRAVSWHTGTKGPLRAEFAAMRVRVADGPVAAHGQHLPGDQARLVG